MSSERRQTDLAWQDGFNTALSIVSEHFERALAEAKPPSAIDAAARGWVTKVPYPSLEWASRQGRITALGFALGEMVAERARLGFEDLKV